MDQTGQLRAVCFDLDDTLLATSASRDDRADLAVACILVHHPHLDAAGLRASILQTGEYPWARGVEPVLRDLGLHASPAAAEAIDSWFFRGCEHLLVPLSDADATIQQLRSGYRLGVITNGLERRQAHKFAQLQLAEYIDVFVTSERAGARKPAREPFALALAEMSVAPGDAVYVGDSIESDITGAMAAGMHAIWFNPEGAPAPPGMDHIHQIRSLVELLPALFSLP